MEIREFLQLEETAFSKGVVGLTVIRAGFNKSKKRYYPAEMLKRDYKVFEGMKMFVDHSTLAQDRSRPEGSVRDWAGNLSKLWVDGDGTVRGEAAIIDEQLKLKLANLREHKQLPTMGISIRAVGEAREAEVEGRRTLLVERLVKGRSVDFVTYAGAGGAVEMLESVYGDEEDVDLQRFKIRTQRFMKMGLSEAEAEHAAIGRGGRDPRKLNSTRIERFQRMGLSEAEAEVAAQGWTLLKENQP